MHLGNWVLKHRADGGNSTYKFHRTVALKPDAHCTVSSTFQNMHFGNYCHEKKLDLLATNKCRNSTEGL